MILFAQSPYLYDSERLAIVRKEYRAFSRLYPHTFLSKPVQQVVSFACHITDCYSFSKHLLSTPRNDFQLHRLTCPGSRPYNPSHEPSYRRYTLAVVPVCLLANFYPLGL